MSEKITNEAFSFDSKSGLGISRGVAPSSVMELRARFVKDMGWLGPDHTDDSDRYDGIDETLHFFSALDNGQIVASMRLTKVNSVKDCLSHEMTKGSVGMYEEISKRADEIDQKAGDDGIWDLTRLVNPLDKSVKGRTIVFAITKMIGFAMSKTDKEGAGENATWVFTTTSKMKGLLDGLGIVSETIAKGKISPDDKYESYFCAIQPIKILSEARESRKPAHLFALWGVDIGLKAADRL